MKIDMNVVLLDLNDEPIKQDEQESKPATLGFVSIRVLLSANLSGDDKLTGSDKFFYHTIAVKIKNSMKAGKMADLEIEEIAIVKERIGRTFGPAVVGPAFAAIEKGGK